MRIRFDPRLGNRAYLKLAENWTIVDTSGLTGYVSKYCESLNHENPSRR